MTTNRKELNGEWRKSIQIDLADPCWASQGGGEWRAGPMKGGKTWESSPWLISLHSTESRNQN